MLTYNTNLSKLTYKDKNILDYWAKWGEQQKLWLWPSIDEIDDRAELIRHGTNWSKVESNLKDVVKLNVHIKPSITVSAMNIHRLPEIIDRLIAIGVIRKIEEFQNFAINMVEQFDRHHVSLLKDHTRLKIKQRLENYIVEYEKQYNTDIRHIFLHAFWHLEKPHDPVKALEFRQATHLLDKIRNENTIMTIPELAEVLG